MGSSSGRSPRARRSICSPTWIWNEGWGSKECFRAAGDLARLRFRRGASDEEARRVFANLVEPMLAVSKCPDFIVNRGHYFGTHYMPGEDGLSDDDKRALIEFLKTM